MDADPWFVDEGDIEAARTLVAAAADAELFLYPGTGTCSRTVACPITHPTAALLRDHVLKFLDRI